MHFSYFPGCPVVFLPNMRASPARRLWPVNSRSRPWCTMRRARGVIKHQRTLPADVLPFLFIWPCTRGSSMNSPDNRPNRTRTPPGPGAATPPGPVPDTHSVRGSEFPPEELEPATRLRNQGDPNEKRHTFHPITRFCGGKPWRVCCLE